MKGTICHLVCGFSLVLGGLGQAQGAKKTLGVSKADFVISQEEASKFSAEIVSSIAFDVAESESEPEPLRTRIRTFLQKPQRHEIDYIALPAYFPLRKMHVLAKVERLDSRPTIILFIPELMDWKKTVPDLEFKYGLLITLVHELIHLEMGHDLRFVSDKEAAKHEADAWGKTILEVVRLLEAKGSPIGRFKQLSDHFRRANDNPSDPTWLKIFMQQ